MRRTILSTVLAFGFVASAIVPGHAERACSDGSRKVDEASALRHQARQEARFGDHDRLCDTLDEVGDRYREAQDAFEDCGDDIVAIDLRSELRALRVAKQVNRCD